jgi:hypothetical protein
MHCCLTYIPASPICLQVASLERRLAAVEGREASLMAELRLPSCGPQAHNPAQTQLQH